MGPEKRTAESVLSAFNPKGYKDPVQPDYEKLLALGKPHVDSFDYFLKDGFAQAAASLLPVFIEDELGNRVECKY